MTNASYAFGDWFSKAVLTLLLGAGMAFFFKSLLIKFLQVIWDTDAKDSSHAP